MSERELPGEERPWGRFLILEDRAGYKVKRIEVESGRRLSLQSHRHRREQWTVVQGLARVTLDERELDLEVGMSVAIPIEARHRVANPGEARLILIEVQTGSYFGEDDITRFEDDFNRIAP